MQAENRQGGGILGVFLKPVIPEGATPALVRMSLLINSLMIKNLLSKQIHNPINS